MKIRIVSPSRKWANGKVTVNNSRIKKDGAKYLFVSLDRQDEQVALLQLTPSQAFQLANDLVDAVEHPTTRRKAD